VPITLEEVSKVRQIRAVTMSALVNSGATTTFINKKIIQEIGSTTYPFQNPIPLLNINGTSNKVIPGRKGHISRTIFTITNLDNQDIVIGIDWLQTHNPQVNW
jgi:hypothetical protein